jgi:YbgC/YbaW family acyl-CoA thioester hydrolase
MVRIYSLQPVVGNAEGDVWGQLPPSGVLRLFEQAAVAAAADEGYDKEFHSKHGTAWVIHRMTLLMHRPAHIGDRLQLTTWLAHMARVRGYREYRLENLSEASAPTVATGIAEWVYIDREKLLPRAIPRQVEDDFEMPGAPLGTYEPPVVEAPARPFESITERVAEWYECDSMGHVNNAVYADWLDSGVRAAMDAWGWPVGVLRMDGLQLRGEYFALDYKRAALPGDRVRIVTRLEGLSGRLCRVHQTISNAEGTELLEATSVYGWADKSGQPADAPERREAH